MLEPTGQSLSYLERLRQDLRATGRAAQVVLVDQAAATVASFADDQAWFVEKVVEDVQQRLQDEFVDTSWPACPSHPNHPLDYRLGAWYCPRDNSLIAPLGSL